MTNIHLVYDPYADKVQVYIESREITAPENKIYSFLDLNGFYKCLLPFRRRYAIWEGLLLELLEEVNDEDLHIIFEGRRTDHQRLWRTQDMRIDGSLHTNRILSQRTLPGGLRKRQRICGKCASAGRS